MAKKKQETKNNKKEKKEVVVKEEKVVKEVPKKESKKESKKDTKKVNKVNDDSIGTTGAIEVEVKDLPTALFNFISMVPTDMDIVHNYGRGI